MRQRHRAANSADLGVGKSRLGLGRLVALDSLLGMSERIYHLRLCYHLAAVLTSESFGVTGLYAGRLFGFNNARVLMLAIYVTRKAAHVALGIVLAVVAVRSERNNALREQHLAAGIAMHSLGKSFSAAGSVLSGVLDYIGVSVNTLCQPLGSAAYLAPSFLDALNTEATKLHKRLPLAKAMLAGLGIDRLFGSVRVLVGRVILGRSHTGRLGVGNRVNIGEWICKKYTARA